MPNAYDIAYALGVGLTAPLWLLSPRARTKVLTAFNQRMGHVPARPDQGPALLIHAVSLGEINATRGLVQRLRQLRPDLHLIISTTTQTGYARAQELYATTPHITLIRYPLDFSAAVQRLLDRLRPSAVVLMELEVWPNFMLHCQRRAIPVLLVNGRVTLPSFRRYRWGGPLVRRMFARLAAVCAQEPLYAERFIALGAQPQRVQVTGTMKFDTALLADRVEGDQELAAAVGLRPGQEPIWVCGSTGPGEETLILQQYRALLASHPALRLALIPRHPERFDEVANLITQAGFNLLRRSQSRIENQESKTPVILGDTMGELRKFYSLADVVFVGRSLVDLGPRQHGSDMIEPAALAKPVLVGPFTGNFADVMSRFRQNQAILEVQSPPQLAEHVARLLHSPPDARALGQRAQRVVHDAKGATDRHLQLILSHLPPAHP